MLLWCYCRKMPEKRKQQTMTAFFTKKPCTTPVTSTSQTPPNPAPTPPSPPTTAPTPAPTALSSTSPTALSAPITAPSQPTSPPETLSTWSAKPPTTVHANLDPPHKDASALVKELFPDAKVHHHDICGTSCTKFSREEIDRQNRQNS